MPKQATAAQHYFATCFYGWAVADTKEKAVKDLKARGGRLARKGVDALVVRVDLPKSAAYNIRSGLPVDVPMGEPEQVTF